jgi:mRNA-degrading endonuclease RelE of RelBE toxin-antitoxin system
MAYKIEYSPDAVNHIAALPRADQVMVVDQVEIQLADQPTLPTRKRKLLRPNPIAIWELRLGEIRVFYDVVEQPEQIVSIIAVGVKRHNELWIGGEKIEL